MAHEKQHNFCLIVRRKFPEYFKGEVTVLDVGSLDINGNNRYLFDADCRYIGLDIIPGKNVDVVCPVHLFWPLERFDVVICTEMLEHDQYQNQSLTAMYKLLKPGGLLLITAAAPGRRPHGITGMSPGASPATNNFYKAPTYKKLKSVLKFKHNFSSSFCQVTKNGKDIYFWGIKI